MTKKDIAFSVGGVIATMVLAYLLYRLQQRDAAAAAATAQANSDAAAAASEAEAYQADPYQQAIAAITTPSITGTANTAAAVTTSGTTADTGSTGTGVDQEDPANLISQIVAEFAGSITSPPSADTVASMTIPTITSTSPNVLNSIPLTAADAAAEAAVPAITVPGDATQVLDYAYPAAMLTGPTVSSHPVTAHPITQTGA